MHQTRSATPLEPVLIEPIGPNTSHVWLRDSILEVLVEDDNGSQRFWDAAEVDADIAGAPSEEEIEADFDEWWERVEEVSLTDAEKLEKLEAQVLFTALMTDTEV